MVLGAGEDVGIREGRRGRSVGEGDGEIDDGEFFFISRTGLSAALITALSSGSSGGRRRRGAGTKSLFHRGDHRHRRRHLHQPATTNRARWPSHLSSPSSFGSLIQSKLLRFPVLHMLDLSVLIPSQRPPFLFEKTGLTGWMNLRHHQPLPPSSSSAFSSSAAPATPSDPFSCTLQKLACAPHPRNRASIRLAALRRPRSPRLPFLPNQTFSSFVLPCPYPATTI